MQGHFKAINPNRNGLKRTNEMCKNNSKMRKLKLEIELNSLCNEIGNL
jgi:hypothetical protein